MRDKGAVLAFMKKAMKRHGSLEVITDGLRSYGAAMTELGSREKQEVGRCASNHVENSYLPFRRRERARFRYRQMKALQKFASVHASVHDHFNLDCHLVDTQTYKERRSAALPSVKRSRARRTSSKICVHRAESASRCNDSTLCRSSWNAGAACN
jgi:putative transposase